MLANRVIEPADNSSYATNIVVVDKKGTEKKRIAINYAGLNRNTIPDQYPLPNIEEMLIRFKGAKYYTTLDLVSAYWQVRLRMQDQYKTAFITQDGHYQFIIMPYRLNNTPATFQKLMNRILKEYLRDFVEVYLDDIIIYSKTLKEHRQHLRKVLFKIRQHQLKLKPEKCEWIKTELKFVGHILNREGILPDPENIRKIQEASPPTNVSEVRRFIGMSSYYRNFIQDYSMIVRPLHDLTKKGVPFEWTNERQQAFDKVKQILTKAPVLVQPDFSKEFKLYTDALQKGLGAILCQKNDEGRDQVIAYAARALNGTEQKYPTINQKTLAVVWAIEKFHHYLDLKTFKLFIDHAA